MSSQGGGSPSRPLQRKALPIPLEGPSFHTAIAALWLTVQQEVGDKVVTHVSLSVFPCSRPQLSSTAQQRRSHTLASPAHHLSTEL